MNSSLKNKNVLITEVLYGVGAEVALEFAKRGSRVILTCLDSSRASNVCQQIRLDSQNDAVEVEPLDLSSLKSIRDFSLRIKNKLIKLDILVNNSGIRELPHTKTSEGFEMHFVFNYLGLYYLTRLLLDLLKSSESSRIINISSEAHRNIQMNWADLQYEKSYSSISCYKQSRLAQVLFTTELTHQLEGTNVGVVTVHPSAFMVDACVNRESSSTCVRFLLWLCQPFFCLFGEVPVDASQTIIFCATSDNIVNGSYYKNCKVVDASAFGTDKISASKLWNISEKLVGLSD